MSGAVKSVKKVFKKAVKSVKKVLPIALGVGAVVFTAGSALGALPSWGDAITSLTGTSTLGNILAGAVTQAGYGAAAGMGVAAVTGGSITKGAQYGSIAGAVTGAASGAAGLPTDPFSKTQPPSPMPGTSQAMNYQTAAGTAGGPTVAAPAATAAGTATGSGVMQPGGWLERNQELVGGLLGGIGESLIAGNEADDAGKTQLQIMRERQRLIADNYGSDGTGLLAPGDTDYIADNGYGFQYAYNPDTGRIEQVPTKH